MLSQVEVIRQIQTILGAEYQVALIVGRANPTIIDRSVIVVVDARQTSPFIIHDDYWADHGPEIVERIVNDIRTYRAMTTVVQTSRLAVTETHFDLRDWKIVESPPH